ncbi:uncharacterized protein LOC127416484 isoform X2 [Myxocyprinus asiaticus]|uniref:uncharacterized protein LOC127416484 isoform X2 n=1 Tax=Myxocyprinus asiaticus TaxID=70543 RepID=UPI002221E870|nr:uncharacterized protein LOC127416484 isoform X2 [Myxocyprinus asiaticus]
MDQKDTEMNEKGVSSSTSGVVVQVREKKGPLRAAIPYMPFPVAVICLFLNTFVPGLGYPHGNRASGHLILRLLQHSFIIGPPQVSASPSGVWRTWSTSGGHVYAVDPARVIHVSACIQNACIV